MPKKTLQLVLFLVGLAILLFFIFNSGIVSNFPIFFQLNAFLLCLALLLSLINMLFKVVRWHYLSIQYQRPISWTDSSVITISSFFYANITPGKIGDLFKAYYMKKKYNLNVQSGISMIFYERFFEIVILFIFSLLILLQRFDDSSVILLQLTSLIIIFLIFFYWKSEVILKYSIKVLLRVRKSERFNITFSLQKIPIIPVIITFFISLVSLIFEFGRLWLVILAFGFYISPVDTAIFFSISIIFGLISQIPLGIGVMEASLSVLLERVGIPADFSIAVVLVDRIISMYFALVLGFLVSQISLVEIMKEEAE